jgi:hypothetical protein
MYVHLDQQKKIIQQAKVSDANRSFEETQNTKLESFGGEKLGWIYRNDIEEVWKEYLGNAGSE